MHSVVGCTSTVAADAASRTGGSAAVSATTWVGAPALTDDMRQIMTIETHLTKSDTPAAAEVHEERIPRTVTPPPISAHRTPNGGTSGHSGRDDRKHGSY
ncbi:hypothetical protein Sm713_12750 [Streptomyces sp. TS71-3]|nr:hypothetical protein Sm713_12750 [Streptomyces sp. TS71-3]